MNEIIAAEVLAAGRRASQENDWDAAAKLFEEAAARGNAEAQYVLGLAYLNGRGVPENKELAVRWFTAAAESGDYDAQYMLGCHYADGSHGVAKSLVQAYRWLAPIANSGSRAEEVLVKILPEMTPEQIEEAQRRAGFYEPMPHAPDLRTLITNELDDLLKAFSHAGGYDFTGSDPSRDEAAAKIDKIVEQATNYLQAGELATICRMNEALATDQLDPVEIRDTALGCFNSFVTCFSTPLLVIHLRGKTAGIRDIDILIDRAKAALNERAQHALGLLSRAVRT